MRRVSVFVLLALAPATAARAAVVSAAAAPGPAIVSVAASSTHLPAAGGNVVITVRVRGATSCTFLSQHGAFSSLYPLKTVPCASGRASVTVPRITNPSAMAVRLTYAVRVRGRGAQTVQRSVTVTESAAVTQADPIRPPLPAAPVATLSLSASSVPATGGAVLVSYASTNASTCTLSSTPAFWAGANPVSVDCTGSYSATVSPSATARQWTFTFTVTSPSGQTASSSQTLTELAAPPPSIPIAGLSSNWSGYVVPSSALVTIVSGRWTVPSLNCASTSNGGSSAWVGIGGYPWLTGGTSGVLLQTGIRADCVNGSAQYMGWFEELPSSETDFVGFPISAGDSIQASVFQGSAGAWETRVDDLTTGLSGVMVTGGGWGVLVDAGDGTFPKQGSTIGLSYSGGYTAEWIVEAYDHNGATVQLANYGRVDFSDLRTSLTPWSLNSTEAISLVQNGVVVSTPSLPSGTGFSVTYTG